jgi:WD40 repeat protein
MLPVLIVLPGRAGCDEQPSTPVVPITAAAFSAEGSAILLGSQRGIQVRSWPLADVSRDDALSGSELRHVHDLKFSPDGRWLLAAGGNPAESGMIELWRWPERQCEHRIAGHADLVYQVAWSSDGATFVTAAADGRCRVFDATTGQERAEFTGHSGAVTTVTFVDDQTIASGDVQNVIRLWNAADGSTRRTLDQHLKPVTDLALRPTLVSESPKGPLMLASASEDRTVRLWQPGIGRLVRFKRLPSVPRTMAWSADGRQLAAGCDDGVVRVLDPDTLQIIREQQLAAGRVLELALHPLSSELLAAGTTGVTVACWQG